MSDPTPRRRPRPRDGRPPPGPGVLRVGAQWRAHWQEELHTIVVPPAPRQRGHQSRCHSLSRLINVGTRLVWDFEYRVNITPSSDQSIIVVLKCKVLRSTHDRDCAVCCRFKLQHSGCCWYWQLRLPLAASDLGSRLGAFGGACQCEDCSRGGPGGWSQSSHQAATLSEVTSSFPGPLQALCHRTSCQNGAGGSLEGWPRHRDCALS